MTCNINAGFQNVTNYNEYQLETQLEDNLKSFLNWGFLNIGAFVNVTKPTQNISNSAGFHILKKRDDPAFSSGRVWETVKKQWIYEETACFNNHYPINISGVYINNQFIPGPTGNQQYPYTLNYDLGRIVFNSSIPTNSIVEMEYSYRNIQTYKGSDNFSNWKELQQFTYLNGEMNKNTTVNHKVQMPSIIIEVIGSSQFKPYELGSLKYWANQDVLLHIFSENYVENKNISDIIKLQKEKLIPLYDVKKVVKNKVYPLNLNGSKNENYIEYPELISSTGYIWKNTYIENISVIEYQALNNNIFYSTIRLSSNTIL